MSGLSQAAGVELTVDGLVYGGWKVAIAQVGMDRVAGSFQLDVTELWPNNDVTRRIRPGSACKLQVAGQTVITGYVDAVAIGIDARSHAVTITGRDSTADLIDCSAVHSPGQWKGVSVVDIATQLAGRYKVPVKLEVDEAPTLLNFALQTGESVYEAIDRAARDRGLLLTSDGGGGLLLTRAGLRRAADEVVYGGNLLSARATLDFRDRYRTYIALGQAAGSDLFSGRQAAQLRAEASDPGIERERTLLLTGGSPDMRGSLRDRAQWEATVRAARSTQVELLLQGLTQSTGVLWQPNHLVHVKAEPLRLDDDLLITSVSYEVSDQGTFTRLQATRADAYTLVPIKAPAAGAKPPFFDKTGTIR